MGLKSPRQAHILTTEKRGVAIMDASESLLQAILGIVARQTFPPAELAKLIATTSGGEKQVIAYNLCNGKTSQTEIGKQANLDKGSLSRSIARWIELGIVIRVGHEQLPLHVYPLPKEYTKQTRTKRAKKNDQ
jgi:DNA-binding HxlR family transcriptional regulator